MTHTHGPLRPCGVHKKPLTSRREAWCGAVRSGPKVQAAPRRLPAGRGGVEAAQLRLDSGGDCGGVPPPPAGGAARGAGLALFFAGQLRTLE